MSLIGIVGLIICLSGLPFSQAGRTRGRGALFTFLLLMHIGAAVAYNLYSQQAGSDVLFYYYDPYQIYGSSSGLSTTFVINFIQVLKSYFGGSLLDYFLLFQAMGFWGILFLLRCFDEIRDDLTLPRQGAAYFLLFLPGIHFWSSAIGKDAPLFLAVAMTVWAALRPRSRYAAFIAALVVMVLVRPHIALLTVIAGSLAVFFQPGTRLAVKAVLVTIAMGSAAGLAVTVETSLNVDLSSADAVSEFLAARSTVAEVGGDTTIVSGSFPVKLFSLLFRPLFFDAGSVFGQIASFENLLLMGLFMILLWHFKTGVNLVRRSFFARFAIIFFSAMTVMLTVVNYNVGLGLRQKVMMMPPLLTFFVAVLSVNAAHRERRLRTAMSREQCVRARESQQRGRSFGPPALRRKRGLT